MCKHKPDDRERLKWQNPENILSDLGVKPGVNFVDAGCGRGFFALPAARMVSPGGRVWGFDINPDAIRYLKQAATDEGLRNIELSIGKAEEIIVCQKCADIVFYGVVLHDFTDPSKVLANARKMLKPGGRLVNLDWKKEKMVYGPSIEKRLSAKEAAEMIQSAGFRIESIKQNGLYHYIIIALP
ncbi:MAG: class I SAM-dependent methyltransferase [Dehalococcoidales bacterium]|jgi:ubiquinone/menaquinone biosynthesis C-methylase UbiE|nr:class I SAM-dependent methyltransferase [Dehalococcoidales bacterium]MDD4229828.1 class I SAM-dependent methyltransferase [Dehalococcoidales bacterium]MDD4465243.1 class I SAM-dependent methyltransferase [Dehalococcoidales bacterium]MDD5401650.1 class I SAM-dependent methyltransferase [Dehalococcoidales bacterium]NLE90779.1 class I SAM-dependent methyltransferase [Dehalococcoidales bacterium]